MSVGDSTRSWDVRWEPGQLGQQDPLSFGQQAPRELSVLRGLAVEVTDEDIEAQKPGNRGLMLSELQGVIRRARIQAEESPGDPRWDELLLRALDRLAKLLRMYEPAGPGEREGDVDRVRLASRVAADLDALEAKITG